MARHDHQTAKRFAGFDRPESNWFRMPNAWTDMTAGITSIAELKVVEYILRHTWGYQEYGVKKHITIDEFVSGRRRQDGSRMDAGTGLSERAVYDGIRKAVEDGLIEEETDASDRGRVKKFFSLRMRESGEAELQNPQIGVQSLQGVQTLQGRLQDLPTRGATSAPRSEKDTSERYYLSNLRKTNVKKQAEHDADAEGGGPAHAAPTKSSVPAPARAAAMLPLGEALAARMGASASAAVPLTDDARAEPRRPQAPRRDRRHRAPYEDEAYQVIQSYLADFARELNDRAPLKTSTTRAYNLYRRSGLDQQAFIAQLYAARAIVKERAASIRSVGEKDAWGVPVKQRAAYYFAVLEDLLGLRAEGEDAPEGPRKDAKSSQTA